MGCRSARRNGPVFSVPAGDGCPGAAAGVGLNESTNGPGGSILSSACQEMINWPRFRSTPCWAENDAGGRFVRSTPIHRSGWSPADRRLGPKPAAVGNHDAETVRPSSGNVHPQAAGLSVTAVKRRQVARASLLAPISSTRPFPRTDGIDLVFEIEGSRVDHPRRSPGGGIPASRSGFRASPGPRRVPCRVRSAGPVAGSDGPAGSSFESRGVSPEPTRSESGRRPTDRTRPRSAPGGAGPSCNPPVHRTTADCRHVGTSTRIGISLRPGFARRDSPRPSDSGVSWVRGQWRRCHGRGRRGA